MGFVGYHIRYGTASIMLSGYPSIDFGYYRSGFILPIAQGFVTIEERPLNSAIQRPLSDWKIEDAPRRKTAGFAAPVSPGAARRVTVGVVLDRVVR